MNKEKSDDKENCYAGQNLKNNRQKKTKPAFLEKKPCSSKGTTNDAQKQGPEKKGIPGGFYIAHPRNLKTGAGNFRDVHTRRLAELSEAFHMFDFDRDGVINHEDLKKTFTSLNRDEEEGEIEQMLSEGLKPFDFDAFVILLGYKTLDLDPEEVFLDALSNWDDGRQGLIPYDRIHRDIMAWGDKFTKEEADSALADAPLVFTKAKEKMIDYFQFCEDLCGLRKMMQRRQSNQD